MECAGLDLHKSFCQTKICTKEGELIKEGRIKTELRRRNLKYPDGAGIFMGKGKKWLCNLKNPVIDSYLAIYETVDRELKNAEREIEKAGKQYEEVKLMTGIKGIGVYSALIIYSEIKDCSRFSNEEKVFSYAGLVPRVHQSGNTSYYGRITKEGSTYLRWILVEAVRVHVRWCPDSKITKHYNKIKKKKGANVAATAAARKLLQVIYPLAEKQGRVPDRRLGVQTLETIHAAGIAGLPREFD